MIAITKSLSHEEYLKKKRKRKLWKLGAILFLTILIISVFAYGSHRQEIRISKIELNGGILVTQSDIESKTLIYMYGSHFWLFPRNNVLWYPHDELEKYLKETFKRIDTINIRRKGFQALVINITERKPFAIWCEGVPKSEVLTSEGGGDTEDTSPKCYFIDQNSTVFAKAPHFSGDAYFKYYGLITFADGESPIGKEYIASTTKFYQISNFVLKAKELSIHPLYLVAKDDNEFSLVLLGGGEIFFDMKKPLSIVGQNLEALLRTPVFASSTRNLPIEYIDLRYGNKLFYKLKQ